MMLHDLAVHVTNIVGDEGVKVIVDATLRPVTDMVSRQVARYLGLPLNEDLHGDALRVEVERIKESISSFKVAMEQLQSDSNVDWERIGEEAQEPSASRFVRRAIDISANTTLESKRLLVGALIAKRLQAPTDSDYEILLRRALDVIEDLTENQLLILAAASLVQNPRTSWKPTSENPSRDEAESALLPLLPIARWFLDMLKFDEDQFGTLASIGAARLKDDSGAIIAYESADPFDAWMQFQGVSPYDGIEGEWGTKESHDAFRRRFPTIAALRALGAKPDGAIIRQGRRLDGMIMTPLGSVIAELVLDQLLEQEAPTLGPQRYPT